MGGLRLPRMPLPSHTRPIASGNPKLGAQYKYCTSTKGDVFVHGRDDVAGWQPCLVQKHLPVLLYDTVLVLLIFTPPPHLPKP